MAWPAADDSDGGRPSGLVVCRFLGAVDHDLLKAAGLVPRIVSPVIPGLVLSAIEFRPSIDLVTRLRERCEYVYQERLFRTTPRHRPPAGPAPAQWHHDVLQTRDIWATLTTGRGASVAVVDQGLDTTVPCLRPGFTYGLGWNDVTGQLDHVTRLSDLQVPVRAHGTQCATLAIGAEDTQLRSSGVAPEANWVPVAVGNADDEASQDRLAIGISVVCDPVAHGINAPPADVISCSLTPGQRSDGSAPLTGALRDALSLAGRMGIVVVWAVANVDADLSLDEVVSHPAVVPAGAVNRNFEGTMARSPDIVAAVGASSAPSIGNRLEMVPNATSFGAPVVAGVAALLRSLNPGLSPAEIRTALGQSIGRTRRGVPILNARDVFGRLVT